MQHTSFRRRLVVLVALLALGGGLVLALFGAGPAPAIEIVADRPGIGPSTSVTVRVSEPNRGLSAVAVALEQGGQRYPLTAATFEARPVWSPWADHTASATLETTVGSQHQDGLIDGEARIVVEAARAPAWLRRPGPATAELVLEVRTTPPRLEIVSTGTRVVQGGSEAVVYDVDTVATRHGVAAGPYFFPGHPLEEGSPVAGRVRAFALFTAPWDLDDDAALRVEAVDELGNRASAAFVDAFTPRPLATGTIRLSDGFLAAVVPQIVERTPSLEPSDDLLSSYLEINGALRRANRERLLALAARSRPEMLWSEPFLALPGGQVMSPFAVRRTYVYDGEAVDEQVHLGFDLASTRHAPVPAANDGVVVLAEYFGIYGNAVVVDHGFGLMSLYAHLSTTAVTVGQAVRRGESLGETGSTGLAGGDHLHFAMLLGGLPADPIEWWDPHWIGDRLARKLPGLFVGGSGGR